MYMKQCDPSKRGTWRKKKANYGDMRYFLLKGSVLLFWRSKTVRVALYDQLFIGQKWREYCARKMPAKPNL